MIPRHPRRIFRYSLQTLFVVVTLICVFLTQPRFFSLLFGLLFAVVIAGSLFVVLVYIPVKKMASLFASKPNQATSVESSGLTLKT